MLLEILQGLLASIGILISIGFIMILFVIVVLLVCLIGAFLYMIWYLIKEAWIDTYRK